MTVNGRLGGPSPAAESVTVWPSGGRALACGLLLSVCFCTAAALILHGGILDPESRSYVAHYISAKPLLAKVFDVNINDLTAYQARELSYLFDYVDAQFIRICIHFGCPHFLSLTALVFATVVLVTTARYCTTDLAMEWPNVVLLLILYLSCPSTIFSASVGRTAKCGVALTIVLGWQLIHRQVRHCPPQMGSYSSWITLLGLGLAASVFDRQGFYVVAMAWMLLALHAYLNRNRHSLRLMTATATAILLNLIYNLIIGPRLIHHFVNYWPSFEYQRLPLDHLYAAPLAWALTGTSLVLDYLRFFVGSITRPQAMIAVALIVWLAARTSTRRSADQTPRLVEQYSAPILLVALLAMLVVMTALMALRHWAVTYDDLRRINYSVPSVALFLMVLTWVFSQIRHRSVLSATCVRLLLAAAVFCNLASLPDHLRIIAGGGLGPSIARSARLLDGLRHVDDVSYVPEPDLVTDWFYQMFREHELHGQSFRFTGIHWEELQ
jgi:hypothetical protein